MIGKDIEVPRFSRLLMYAGATMLILGQYSCVDSGQKDATLSKEYQPIILGLSSQMVSDPQTTSIDLIDFVIPNVQPDSVTFQGLKLEITNASVEFHAWLGDAELEPLRIWLNGTSEVIPIRRTKKRKYRFKFDSQGRPFGTVKIKGEMTAWNPDVIQFTESQGVYEAEIIMEPGSYQYIMVLDGEEMLDFNNPESMDNGIGGFNSVLDFDSSEENKMALSARYQNEAIHLSCSNPGIKYLALWNNREVPVKSLDGLSSVSVPAHAKTLERSFVRVWAYDEVGISNELLIPLVAGIPMSNASSIDREDKHAMSLYNVFIDRFHNGDNTNDRPVNTGEILPKANDHGGDISGAIEKLKEGYFQELGINTIWISPIVKNVEGAFGEWPDPATKFSAYHGYWPVSFTLIDDRKGTAEELHELVNLAHENEMNVLLDFVANHVHEEHPFYKSRPEVATNLYLPDGSLNTERWDDHRLTTWFDVFLPTLQLDNPEVYEMLTDSAVFWIQEYNLDGFRHDATKHVPEIFWKTLTRKLKGRVIVTGKEIYQIGETYGTPELISSYVNSGQLDAQFDFNVYDAVVATLCRSEVGFEKIDQVIHQSLRVYGDHHLMGNITGNQDKGRFISYAGGELRFDENSKVAGWTREVGIGKPEAFKKSELLMGLIATIPGLPVIYYGDEVGSYGGNDPDNRKMMQFEGLNESQSELKNKTSTLLKYRANSLPLIYGDFRTHLVEKDVFVYSRNYLDQSVFIAMNNSSEPQVISFKPDENQKLSESDSIQINLEPYSFEIID